MKNVEKKKTLGPCSQLENIVYSVERSPCEYFDGEKRPSHVYLAGHVLASRRL